MRHRHWRSALLRRAAVLGLVCALALGGCTDDSDSAAVGGTVSLTAATAAALGGLSFDFANAAIFDFPGESAVLGFGADGSTFTLTTSGGATITGTIAFGSCRLTQSPAPVGAGQAPFDVVYDICDVSGGAEDDIDFGGSGNGTLTLRLARAGQAPVDSTPEEVVFHVDTAGNVTINENMTPIGVIA